MQPIFAFGLGPMEIAIVGIVGILLFGNRLPGVMRSLGSSFVEFKKGAQGIEDGAKDINDEVRKNLP